MSNLTQPDILVAIALLTIGTVACAAQVDITAPGSVAFGASVRTLPNGNFVVTDPSGPTANIGTVYLYTYDGKKISSFTGSSPNDQVGSGGIAVLANGNFVVVSPHWTNGSATNAGAVTWVNGTTGLSGVVSTDNSLVGTSVNDQIGYAYAPFIVPYDSAADYSIVTLPNGNYLVASPFWNNGAATQAGAVTFANGGTGLSGAVSMTNSLVGTHTNDQVGSGNYAFVGNGNVVIFTPTWSSGVASQVGAVTWIKGTSALSGAVSPSNSLIGLSTGDQVGLNVLQLSNGNYVVLSPNWSNGSATNAGAATWLAGNAPTSGVVSPANSLIGSSANDQVGAGYSVALRNGNYVVCSPDWSRSGTAGAGAATWGDGGLGTVGTLSATNSLVGAASNDGVCNNGVFALTNGHYVVASSAWSNGAAMSVGAVTWGDGSTGLSGDMDSANSLIGATSNDQVGYLGVVALTNGNYVVASPYWSNGGAASVGAVTWRDGSAGIGGVVSAANSLVGTSANDRVGVNGAYALTNGNYVVGSELWTNVGVSNAGAATWGDGTHGTSGAVSPANSLVGAQTDDLVGESITVLGDANYAVSSSAWANGVMAQAGALTVGSGTGGISGTISAANSLVGTHAKDGVGFRTHALGDGDFLVGSSAWNDAAGAVTRSSGAAPIVGAVSTTNSFFGIDAGDQIGSGPKIGTIIVNGLHPLADGNYLILSAKFSNGTASNAGAITLVGGKSALTGHVQASNSVLGTLMDEGTQMPFDYDATHQQLVVGRPLENKISLLSLDAIFANGFE